MTPPSARRRPLLNAGLAALVACAACCALPLLAAAGVGGGALTALAAHVAPGTELAVGGALLALALGANGSLRALRRARSGSRAAGCATECAAGGGCCDAAAPRES